MSRHVAISILTAGLGQLIHVDQPRYGHIKACRVSRLIHRGGWDYDIEHICERATWLDLVCAIFPDASEHYDKRFDTVEQSYLYRLADERKSRNTSKTHS